MTNGVNRSAYIPQKIISNKQFQAYRSKKINSSKRIDTLPKN